MARLPFEGNVRVDIYRTSNAASASVTPTTAPAVTNQIAHICDAMSGLRAAGDHLNYTHVLDLPRGTDIRDAYVSQQGTYSPGQADTVGVRDADGNRVYYRVVLVKTAYKGTPFELTRVFLDRLYNTTWPSDAV